MTKKVIITDHPFDKDLVKLEIDGKTILYVPRALAQRYKEIWGNKE